jgi:hypothetical protein
MAEGNGSVMLFPTPLLESAFGSSQPDKLPPPAPGDEVADSVVEPELEELASSRLSGRGGGDAGLPARMESRGQFYKTQFFHPQILGNSA